MKFELGYEHDFEVRKYFYVTEKMSGIRIAFLSDFHFNRFGEYLLNSVISEISALKPDIILLGGDYVDSRRGLYYFEILINALSEQENVFAISGNHDMWRMKAITKIVRESKVRWIDGESVITNVKGLNIRIDGGAPRQDRARDVFSVLFIHRPIDISLFQFNYNLAFAGHLHGSQFVFWKYKFNLYPGRLFYRWNILSAIFGRCQYFISKGLGDTLPIRYNCKRDLILVETVEKN